MKTLKEFRTTAVPMTKAAFENVYGVTDVRADKVIVYGGGYFIECFSDGSYGTVFLNQDFTDTTLFVVEELFWDAYVAGEVVKRNDHAIMFEDMVNRYAFKYRIQGEGDLIYIASFVEAKMRAADADNQLGEGILLSFIANLDAYNHNLHCEKVDNYNMIINEFMLGTDRIIEDYFNNFEELMKVVAKIQGETDYRWVATTNRTSFEENGKAKAACILEGLEHNTFFAVGLFIKELKK